MINQNTVSNARDTFAATFATALAAFAALLETEQLRGIAEAGVNCEANRIGRKVTVKPGQKYIKVDVGSSGRYMVEASTGNIFGIKGYGTIHRGHWYGTLDTVAEYDWSQYYPSKKDGSTRTQRGNCPVITHAPEVAA